MAFFVIWSSSRNSTGYIQCTQIQFGAPHDKCPCGRSWPVRTSVSMASSFVMGLKANRSTSYDGFIARNFSLCMGRIALPGKWAITSLPNRSVRAQLLTTTYCYLLISYNLAVHLIIHSWREFTSGTCSPVQDSILATSYVPLLTRHDH